MPSIASRSGGTGRAHLSVYIDILDISSISISIVVFDHSFPLQNFESYRNIKFYLGIALVHGCGIQKHDIKTASRHKKDTKNETLWLRVLTNEEFT